jgi:hypothetical protein
MDFWYNNPGRQPGFNHHNPGPGATSPDPRYGDKASEHECAEHELRLALQLAKRELRRSLTLYLFNRLFPRCFSDVDRVVVDHSKNAENLLLEFFESANCEPTMYLARLASAGTSNPALADHIHLLQWSFSPSELASVLSHMGEEVFEYIGAVATSLGAARTKVRPRDYEGITRILIDQAAKAQRAATQPTRTPVFTNYEASFRRTETEPQPHELGLSSQHNNAARNLDLKSPAGGCAVECGLRRDCGHQCERRCHVNACEEEPCRKACSRIHEPCHHRCKKLCCEPCGKCEEPVRMIFNCPDRHISTAKCWQNFDPAHCETLRQVRHPLCGHMLNVPCNKSRDADYLSGIDCKEKCGLPREDCGHQCKNLCSRCQGPGGVSDDAEISHFLPCSEKCTRTLCCGHLCAEPCSNICPPCSQKCRTRCVHSAGQHETCCEPCVPCAEPCPVACPHRKCTMPCGVECNVEPCNEPCGETFECGHQCRGLCGEPCPRCLECEPVADDDENLYVPDDGKMPFVRVGDCGHIFDVETFDGFMKAEAEKSRVQPIECPQCKQPIGLHTMPRYKRQLVIVDRGIQEAKLKMQQTRDDIKRQRAAAGNLLSDLQKDRSQLPGFLECVYLFGLRFDATKKGANLQLDQLLVARIRALHFLSKLVLKPDFGTAAAQDIAQFRTSLVATLARELMARCTPAAVDQFTADRMGEAIDIAVSRNYNIIPEALRAEQERFRRGSEVDLNQIVVLLAKIVEIVAQATKSAELQMIHNALREASSIQPKGAWYKCPNGHLYTIGDCGGALVRAKCLECGAVIGGENHRAAEGNRHSGEPDGSAGPAWPQ